MSKTPVSGVVVCETCNLSWEPYWFNRCPGCFPPPDLALHVGQVLPSVDESVRRWAEARDKAQAGGKKYDEEKPRMALLDPYAMEELSKVLTFGAQKYSAWNWAEGIHYSRLLSACLRHVFAFLRGEDVDPESGLNHLAHAMCCLMFCLSMTKRKPELDDRGPKV